MCNEKPILRTILFEVVYIYMIIFYLVFPGLVCGFLILGLRVHIIFNLYIFTVHLLCS